MEMSIISGSDDVLKDNCMLDGSKDWRSTKNDDEMIIQLGCKQDIKTFVIKNGNKEYQTENFSISIAYDLDGPWLTILEDSLNSSKSEVTF